MCVTHLFSVFCCVWNNKCPACRSSASSIASQRIHHRQKYVHKGQSHQHPWLMAISVEKERHESNEKQKKNKNSNKFFCIWNHTVGIGGLSYLSLIEWRLRCVVVVVLVCCARLRERPSTVSSADWITRDTTNDIKRSEISSFLSWKYNEGQVRKTDFLYVLDFFVVVVVFVVVHRISWIGDWFTDDLAW